jgi:hypothetical protein
LRDSPKNISGIPEHTDSNAKPCATAGQRHFGGPSSPSVDLAPCSNASSTKITSALATDEELKILTDEEPGVKHLLKNVSLDDSKVYVVKLPRYRRRFQGRKGALQVWRSYKLLN